MKLEIALTRDNSVKTRNDSPNLLRTKPLGGLRQPRENSTKRVFVETIIIVVFLWFSLTFSDFRLRNNEIVDK